MNKLMFIVLLARIVAGQLENAAVEQNKKKISEYILATLEHFKQDDPVGLPYLPIQDPMDLPDQRQNVIMNDLKMRNIKLHGLKNFRIHHIRIDLASMKAEAGLTMDLLLLRGNYTLGSWFSKSEGPFTVKLKDVYVQGNSTLVVEANGQLASEAMEMNINFKNLDINFERLGMFASMFQGVVNSIGASIFDSIKPFILSEANNNLRKTVNEQLSTIPQKFPDSISPLDQIISELRQKVKQMGYDPYRVADYNHTAGLIGVQMKNTWMIGLASFHRTGDVIFEMQNNTLIANLQVGTQELQGSSSWEVSLGPGIIARTGSVFFTVNYLKVAIVLAQSMDTRISPVLEDVQLELGNIQIRCSGAGTLDYIVEFVINFLPNILRYQLMDALESPIRMRVQEKLNAVNVERIIKDNIAALDEHQETGFKGFL